MLSSPARALAIDGAVWERSADEVDDAVIARLVRTRVSMERKQGWVVLALLVLPLAMALFVGAHFHSEVVLAATAALAATLGVSLAFSVEHAFLRLFVSEGRGAGLSESAARLLFERASNAGHMLDVMRSCGKEPTDNDLATFVR